MHRRYGGLATEVSSAMAAIGLRNRQMRALRRAASDNRRRENPGHVHGHMHVVIMNFLALPDRRSL